MAVMDTTTVQDPQQWADATLVFSESDLVDSGPRVTTETVVTDVAGAGDVATGADRVSISGPRPAVEKYLERAFIPIAAVLDVYPSSLAVGTPPVDVRIRFRALANTWQEESAHMSSVTDMAMLPSYQEVIGLAERAPADL